MNLISERNLFEKKRITSGQKALTKSQVNILLSSIINIEEQALLVLAIYTGLRRSDIVSVERSNISFEKHELTFYQHKKRNIHKVFLNNHVEQILQMWLNRSYKSKWLFPSHFKKGDHLSSKTAYNILQRNLKRAKLPLRPFHALRATCIKLHQKAGYTPEQTAQLVNDSLRVIEQHYTTPSDEEMKAAIRDKDIL